MSWKIFDESAADVTDRKQSMLCMPIYNLDGDVIAVAQAFNKNAAEAESRGREPELQTNDRENGDDVTRGGHFTEDDEKVSTVQTEPTR